MEKDRAKRENKKRQREIMGKIEKDSDRKKREKGVVVERERKIECERERQNDKKWITRDRRKER